MSAVLKCEGKTILFLSHYLSNSTPLYANRDKADITVKSSISHGDTSNSLSLCFGNHASTHVDAQKHFIDNLLLICFTLS